MVHDLAHRFRNGLYETPRREWEMIDIAKQQIDAQNKIRRSIEKSGKEQYQVISDELKHQTIDLETAIYNLGEDINEGLQQMSDRLATELDVLGDRICAELTEIQWQLMQQNEKLSKIINILVNRRNIDAQELVRQGVKHYLCGEYEEAEERFVKALQNDTTDYQVLMNLGYIEVHKNNAESAIKYFSKAINLSEELDSYSKSISFWSIARVYYAEKDFENAYAYARKAFSVNNEVSNLFKLGVYAGLAGHKKEALKYISDAITKDNTYFAKAVVEPDLQSIRNEILDLLSSIAEKVRSKAISILKEVEKELEFDGKNHVQSYIERINTAINEAKEKLVNPTYTDCLLCITNLKILKEGLPYLKKLQASYSEQANLNQTIKSLNTKYKDKTKNGRPERPDDPEFFPFFLGIFYFCAWFFVAIEVALQGKDSYEMITGFIAGLLAGFIWPLGAIVGLLGGPGYAAIMLPGALKGIVFALFLSYLVYEIKNWKIRKYEKFNSEIEPTEHLLNKSKNDLNRMEKEIWHDEDSLSQILGKIK